MRALLLRQVIQQLPQTRVVRPSRRLFVEAARLHFHRSCLAPDRFEPEWAYQPDWFPVHETSDVLTANERHVLTELVPKEFDEAPPVTRLLAAHAVENRGRSRKILPQAVSVVGIDPLVFFFKRDG